MSIHTAILESETESKIITTKKLSIQDRKDFNTDKVKFKCCECSQYLIISISNKGRVHLKHKPNSKNCILKDIRTDKELIEEINEVNYGRESERHKSLKNKIAKVLSQKEGVTNIEVEKTVNSETGQWRRPDVYCEYNGNKIGFEVQISTISHRYIHYRKEFYSKKNLYLLWVLDDFDETKQKQMQKDIKYLNQQENLFFLNENYGNKLFLCRYKQPFIRDFKIHQKWKSKLVDLSDIIFQKNFELYFYDFYAEKIKLQKELTLLKKEEETRLEKIRLEEEKIKKQEELKLQEKKKQQEINSLKNNIAENEKEIKELENLDSEKYVRKKISEIKDMVTKGEYRQNYEEFTRFSTTKEVYKVIYERLIKLHDLRDSITYIPRIKEELSQREHIERKGFNQKYVIINPKEDSFIQYEEKLFSRLLHTKQKPIPATYGKYELTKDIQNNWRQTRHGSSSYTFFISLDDVNNYYDLKLSKCKKEHEDIMNELRSKLNYLVSQHKEYKQHKISYLSEKTERIKNDLNTLEK